MNLTKIPIEIWENILSHDEASLLHFALVNKQCFAIFNAVKYQISRQINKKMQNSNLTRDVPKYCRRCYYRAKISKFEYWLVALEYTWTTKQYLSFLWIAKTQITYVFSNERISSNIDNIFEIIISENQIDKNNTYDHYINIMCGINYILYIIGTDIKHYTRHYGNYGIIGLFIGKIIKFYNKRYLPEIFNSIIKIFNLQEFSHHRIINELLRSRYVDNIEIIEIFIEYLGKNDISLEELGTKYFIDFINNNKSCSLDDVSRFLSLVSSNSNIIRNLNLDKEKILIEALNSKSFLLAYSSKYISKYNPNECFVYSHTSVSVEKTIINNSKNSNNTLDNIEGIIAIFKPFITSDNSFNLYISTYISGLIRLGNTEKYMKLMVGILNSLDAPKANGLIFSIDKLLKTCIAKSIDYDNTECLDIICKLAIFTDERYYPLRQYIVDYALDANRNDIAGDFKKIIDLEIPKRVKEKINVLDEHGLLEMERLINPMLL